MHHNTIGTIPLRFNTLSLFFLRPPRAMPYTLSRLQAHNGKRKSAWKVDIFSSSRSVRFFVHLIWSCSVESFFFFIHILRICQRCEYTWRVEAPTKNRNNTLAWKVTKLARRQVACSRCSRVEKFIASRCTTHTSNAFAVHFIVFAVMDWIALHTCSVFALHTTAHA